MAFNEEPAGTELVKKATALGFQHFSKRLTSSHDLHPWPESGVNARGGGRCPHSERRFEAREQVMSASSGLP
jgi:hypothetical protein